MELLSKLIFVKPENIKSTICTRMVDKKTKLNDIDLEIHKKIIVEDDNKKLFLERNYIELINPYKELIYQGKTATGKHIYKEDVYFSSIKSLVEIDDWICQNLFILRSTKK